MRYFINVLHKCNIDDTCYNACDISLDIISFVIVMMQRVKIEILLYICDEIKTQNL